MQGAKENRNRDAPEKQLDRVTSHIFRSGILFSHDAFVPATRPFEIRYIVSMRENPFQYILLRESRVARNFRRLSDFH